MNLNWVTVIIKTENYNFAKFTCVEHFAYSFFMFAPIFH